MPLIELHVVEGYTDEDKTRMGEVLTDAIRTIIPASADLVTILINELPRHQYMRGRSHRGGAPALPDAGQIVREFLEAMEARDLLKARTYLSENFRMRFPGTGPLSSLEALVNWAKPRYKFVHKTYDGFDTAPSSGEYVTVYCFGTLCGEWPDGTAFDGIRFIDRFEVTNGKLSRQDVWNDIAEVRP